MTLLAHLKPFQIAEIARIEAEPSVLRRLSDMGIRTGAAIEVVGRAPFSGPFIIRTQGATFALREGEASCIHVQALSPSS